jgi:hypothetical protein
MPKQALRDALATLHTELGAAQSLDAESRKLLADSLLEIAEALDHGDGHDAHATFADRFRSAVGRFEGDHPDLTRAVARVAEALGAAGI